MDAEVGQLGIELGETGGELAVLLLEPARALFTTGEFAAEGSGGQGTECHGSASRCGQRTEATTD
jgi:hypothetical protein